jgi:DNA-directed RNA polymerase subunit alpha
MGKGAEARMGDLQRQVMDMGLSETDLSVRVCNMLEQKGIYTVRDLLDTTEGQLMKIANFGPKTLDQCLGVLAKLGFEKVVPPEEEEYE